MYNQSWQPLIQRSNKFHHDLHRDHFALRQYYGLPKISSSVEVMKKVSRDWCRSCINDTIHPDGRPNLGRQRAHRRYRPSLHELAANLEKEMWMTRFDWMLIKPNSQRTLTYRLIESRQLLPAAELYRHRFDVVLESNRCDDRRHIAIIRNRHAPSASPPQTPHNRRA